LTLPWFHSLQKFWSEEGFDPTGKKLLLAVSGGCDSVALVEFFHREIAPASHCQLIAVHVNHRLRLEADADQDFVEKLCRKRGIPLEVDVLNPTNRATGQSVEMWGREKRYQAFSRIGKKEKVDFTLTAHHLDDVVETFCLRMWRGTGFVGLAGIPFQRSPGNERNENVVRPFLPVSRAELKEWLTALGTSWREDASNADLEIPRNWVRHRLLPDWRKQEPDLDGRVFKLTREVAKLQPLWERWLNASYSPEEVKMRGGIPMEWIRSEGADADFLKRLLPLLGVEKPLPQVMAEILRQTKDSHGSIQVRVDEVMVLTEKNGILKSIFKQ
jgi:tRNA(Ile)-lysidine synthetase-like protein